MLVKGYNEWPVGDEECDLEPIQCGSMDIIPSLRPLSEVLSAQNSSRMKIKKIVDASHRSVVLPLTPDSDP